MGEPEEDPDFIVCDEDDMNEANALKSTIKIDCENVMAKKEFGGVFRLVVLMNLKHGFTNV